MFHSYSWIIGGNETLIRYIALIVDCYLQHNGGRSPICNRRPAEEEEIIMVPSLILRAVFASVTLSTLSYAQVNLVPFVESVSVVEEAFQSRHCSNVEGKNEMGA